MAGKKLEDIEQRRKDIVARITKKKEQEDKAVTNDRPLTCVAKPTILIQI